MQNIDEKKFVTLLQKKNLYSTFIQIGQIQKNDNQNISVTTKYTIQRADHVQKRPFQASPSKPA